MNAAPTAAVSRDPARWPVRRAACLTIGNRNGTDCRDDKNGSATRRELRVLEYDSQKHAVTNAMAQRPIFLLLALVAPSAGRPYHDDRKTKHGHTCACRPARATARRAPARL